MSQFKPGAMAMIIGANSLTQNIGKIVELSALVQNGDIYAGPDAQLYRHSDVDCWVVRGEGVHFRADDDIYEGFGLCEQRHLMLLPGDAQPEQQKSREVVA